MQAKLVALLRTTNDRMLTVARIILGSVMFAHGAQKVFGWYGGAGFGSTLAYFGHNLGIPAPLAVLAIAAEFLGGLFLILGLLGRLSALGIAVNMAVAALLVHLRYGLFMNWFGTKSGEGIEYHLLALALASLIVVRGSGALSLDRLLSNALQTHSTSEPFQPAVAVPRMIRASWMWFAQYHRRS
jgi:putative oxidoreductase